MVLRRATARKRWGVTLVESAFVMSLALLFFFGILEHARYVMTLQLLNNAAREGARYAVVHTHDGTTAQVQDVTDAALGGQGQQMQSYSKTTNITVFKADPVTGTSTGVWTDAKFGESIEVKISGTYTPILPVFLQMSSTMQVQGICIMRSEAN